MYRNIELTRVPTTIGLLTASNVIAILSQGLMVLNVAFLVRGLRLKGQSSSGIVRTPDMIADRKLHQSLRSSHCISVSSLIHSHTSLKKKKLYST